MHAPEDQPDEGTVLCALDESPNASGAVAYAAWLSREARASLTLSETVSPELGTAGGERVDLVVVAISPDGRWTERAICELVEGARTPLVILSESAAECWNDPERARRTVRPTVVYGVGGPSVALAGIGHAESIAKRLRGRLILVSARRAVRRPIGAVDDRLADVLSRGVSERDAGELARRARSAMVDHHASCGDPVEVLDWIASSKGAAMIGVATRGLDATRRVLGGSVTLELLRQTDHPVLITPSCTSRRPRDRASG